MIENIAMMVLLLGIGAVIGFAVFVCLLCVNYKE